MSRVVSNPECASRAPSETLVALQVRGLLARSSPGALPCERRKTGRTPFPHLVQLTPVDRRTAQPVGSPIVVVAKELSTRGLGFFHQFPLSYRRASVTLEDAEGHPLCLLIDLSWCRFTRLGWYESGGRFLQVLSPLGSDATTSSDLCVSACDPVLPAEIATGPAADVAAGNAAASAAQ